MEVTRQEINNLEELIVQGHRLQPQLGEYGNNIVETLQHHDPEMFNSINFDLGDVKLFERALDKVNRDYGGDPTQLGDVIRGRIVVDTPEQIEELRHFLHENQEQLGIEKLKDGFSDPYDTDFRSMNGKIRIQDPATGESQVAEFRVDHRGLTEASKDHLTSGPYRDYKGHELYEMQQSVEQQMQEGGKTLELRAQHNELVDAQRQLYQPVVEANHLDTLEGSGQKITADVPRVTSAEKVSLDSLTMPSSAASNAADTATAEPNNANKADAAGNEAETADANASANAGQSAEEAADAGRSGGNAADTGKSASEWAGEAKALSNAADAATLGKMGVITSVGVTVGVATLLNKAHAANREAVEKLHDEGRINEETLEDYKALNEEIETMMQAENAAAQGWSFIATTPAVELAARNKFQEFSNEHNLSPEVHDMLSMSMFDSQSLQARFANEVKDALPDDPADAPEALQDLTAAKNALDPQMRGDMISYYGEESAIGQKLQKLEKLEDEYGNYTYSGRGAEQAQAEIRQEMNEINEELEQHFHEEFQQVMDSTEGAQQVMETLPSEQAIEIAKTMAEYSDDPAQHNTKIAELNELEQQQESLHTTRGVRQHDEYNQIQSRIDEIRDELKSNPEEIAEYFASRKPNMQSEQETSEAETAQSLEAGGAELYALFNDLKEAGKLDDAITGRPELQALHEHFKAAPEDRDGFEAQYENMMAGLEDDFADEIDEDITEMKDALEKAERQQQAAQEQRQAELRQNREPENQHDTTPNPADVMA